MLKDPYAVMRALLRAEAARNGTPLPPKTDPKKQAAHERRRPAPERSRD